MKNKKTHIVCFGEMLWDMLPNGKKPGGAPMNVAIHLNNFGNKVSLISKVGHDYLGRELTNFIQNSGLDNSFIQTGETHLTGVVKVNLDDQSEVSYKIVEPVAWDYIELKKDLIPLVAQSDCIVFGSLACRSMVTFETLKSLLQVSKYRIFDINLRKPFFKKEDIRFLLSQTDLLKLNEHELEVVAEWFGLDKIPSKFLQLISDQFKIETVCLTLGSQGAIVFNNGEIFRCNGFPVEVRDTIGSGDAFLAGFIHQKFFNESLENCLSSACAIGAIVATYEGGTPKINNNQINNLLKNSYSVQPL